MKMTIKKMKKLSYLTLFNIFIVAALLFQGQAQAQPQLKKDYSYVMEIPSVLAMESSPAHLYVLSDSEGMVVFRSRPDTLQWLYSSTGMQQRGNQLTADIRFAYLFGNSRRLTVLEPTSVLGVYSSTLLPENPLDAKRIDQSLYVALGSKGLGKLSLRTPASVDSTVELVDRSRLRNDKIIDLEASDTQLFALAAAGKLYIFNQTEGEPVFDRELSLLRELNHIFLVGQNLMGSDSEGNIYEIDRTGNLSKLGEIGETVKKIASWNNFLFIKGVSNRIWTSYQNRSPVLWKDDGEAGNYFTVAKGRLWLSEYNRISRIVTGNTGNNITANAPADSLATLKLAPIADQIIPYPKPLLLSLKLQNNIPADQLQFTYQSDIESATIKGNGFYWQPKAEDVGTHRFKIVATASNGQADSTSFTVDVRSFNAPPRFTPLRPITIPVGEPFTLPIKALDRDGMNQDLVRYIGVDLPENASINEQTGEFSWTPTARQAGENRFRVIATDQYGAAASVDVTIRVISASREEGGN